MILKAQRQLGRATDALSATYERLSSGQRINKASDDAAGLAISSSLNASGKVFTQAIRNVNDGLSALGIAEGALTQLSSVMVRQKELAEQAANGTYTLTQRKALHTEANALVDEFNRIVASTSFNGQNVLDGSYTNVRLQAGFGLDGSLLLGVGNDLQRNIGNGTANVAVTFVSAFYPTRVDSADFDGDGRADVVASNGQYINVYRGNGDGSFQAAMSINTFYAGSGVSNVAVGDFNGDGRPDIFTPAYNLTPTAATIINAGGGTFATANTTAALPGNGNWSTIFAIQVEGTGDFNGDGFDDVILNNGNVTAGQGEIAILLSNGNGTFQTPITRTLSAGISNTSGSTIADYNNDGLADVAINNFAVNQISIFYGQRSGGLSLQATNVSTSTQLGFNNPISISSGDFNEDGSEDLFVTNTGGIAGVLLNNGNGALLAEQPIPCLLEAVLLELV